MIDIRKRSLELADYITDRRRHYHQCPELALCEHETIASMEADLKAIGISDVTRLKNCCGLVAVIEGSAPGKTLALRTDIDALPVAEATGLPFASKNGCMHACGHDGHMAMFLGAAKMLFEMKDQLKGRIFLVVQPAEEGGNGSKLVMEGYDLSSVDAFYGAHIWAGLEDGLIDVFDGPKMCGCEKFDLIVEGVAAHGSAPNLGKDAITASAALIDSLQQIISRQNDPLSPKVLTVGTIHGGSRFNVIANRVAMAGCCRTIEPGGWMEGHMQTIMDGIAKTFGVKAYFENFWCSAAPLFNDSALSETAKLSCEKLFGKESLKEQPLIMASEDFSFFNEIAPCLFAYIGCRNEEKGYIYGNHHEKFDFDEALLSKGAALMAQFAVDFLGKAEA